MTEHEQPPTTEIDWEASAKVLSLALDRAQVRVLELERSLKAAAWSADWWSDTAAHHQQRAENALASLRRVAGMLLEERSIKEWAFRELEQLRGTLTEFATRFTQQHAESKRLWDILNAAELVDTTEAFTRITRALAWAARQECTLVNPAIDAVDSLRTLIQKRAVDLAAERAAHERTREALKGWLDANGPGGWIDKQREALRAIITHVEINGGKDMARYSTICCIARRALEGGE